MSLYQFLDENMFEVGIICLIGFTFFLVLTTTPRENTPYEECVQNVVGFNHDPKHVDFLISYCKDLK